MQPRMNHFLSIDQPGLNLRILQPFYKVRRRARVPGG